MALDTDNMTTKDLKAANPTSQSDRMAAQEELKWRKTEENNIMRLQQDKARLEQQLQERLTQGIKEDDIKTETGVRIKALIKSIDKKLEPLEAQYRKDNAIPEGQKVVLTAANNPPPPAAVMPPVVTVENQSVQPAAKTVVNNQTQQQNPNIGTAKLDNLMNNAEVLQIGSSGDKVKALQKMLGIKEDGNFGEQTAEAVKKFQEKNGYTVDGIVGPETNRGIYSSIKVAGVDLNGVKLTNAVTGGDNVSSTQLQTLLDNTPKNNGKIVGL